MRAFTVRSPSPLHHARPLRAHKVACRAYEDPFSTLGVPKNAEEKDVKKAYRRLALRYHPDVNKDELAEKKFRALREAYELLMGRGDDTGRARAPFGGNWDFHDWYWSFSMKQRQARQGNAAAGRHSAAAAQAHKPAVHSQLANLKRRAAQRRASQPRSVDAFARDFAAASDEQAANAGTCCARAPDWESVGPRWQANARAPDLMSADADVRPAPRHAKSSGTVRDARPDTSHPHDDAPRSHERLNKVRDALERALSWRHRGMDDWARSAHSIVSARFEAHCEAHARLQERLRVLVRLPHADSTSARPARKHEHGAVDARVAADDWTSHPSDDLADTHPSARSGQYEHSQARPRFVSSESSRSAVTAQLAGLRRKAILHK